MMGLHTLFESDTDLLMYPPGLLLLLKIYGNHMPMYVELANDALRQYRHVIDNCPCHHCAANPRAAYDIPCLKSSLIKYSSDCQLDSLERLRLSSGVVVDV